MAVRRLGTLSARPVGVSEVSPFWMRFARCATQELFREVERLTISTKYRPSASASDQEFLLIAQRPHAISTHEEMNLSS